MELENNIDTNDGLAEIETGKELKFHTLLVVAALLFGINVLVAMFFYVSPSFLASTVRADDSGQYAAGKSSAFEERVKESRWRPRPVEKIRPVLEAAAPVPDPTTFDSTAQPAGSTTNSDFTQAVYTNDTGARPVASAYHLDKQEDVSSHAASVAASVAPRNTDLQ